MINLEQFVIDNVNDGNSVLDIGCGIKTYSNIIKNKTSKVITIDAWGNVSPDIVMDISKTKLPFNKNEFDVGLMIDLIEHLDKNDGLFALDEAKRVCKKIILLTPLWWDDNHENTSNSSLWCYGNEYNHHKSLWSPDDFGGFTQYEYGNYFLGIFQKIS